MTSVDDILFEPIGSPVFGTSTKASNSLVASGIMKRSDATAVDIIVANPKQLYMDAAKDIMDHAVTCQPLMLDLRKPLSMKLPIGLVRLDDLVRRFHDGDKDFWVSCPKLTSPRQFEFAGRFGFFKLHRLAELMPNNPAMSIKPYIIDWFWIDTSDGQLSSLQVGLMLTAPNLLMHYAFLNQNDAQTYYTTP